MFINYLIRFQDAKFQCEIVSSLSTLTVPWLKCGSRLSQIYSVLRLILWEFYGHYYDAGCYFWVLISNHNCPKKQRKSQTTESKRSHYTERPLRMGLLAAVTLAF